MTFADFIIEAMIQARASGTQSVTNSRLWQCDYEGCPGRSSRHKKRLIWHTRYLFVHNQCVAMARRAALARHEMFGFRLGL